MKRIGFFFGSAALAPALLVLLLLLPAGPALAQCGPGPWLWGRPGPLPMTTNFLLAPTSTAAMISSTSGCGPGRHASLETRQREFLATNFEPLTQQLARGGGPHLEAFAALLQCRDTARGAFARMTREKWGVLVPKGGRKPVALLIRLKIEIARDPTLAAGCAPAG